MAAMRRCISEADDARISDGYEDDWDEGKHPRGQPNNAGQFASGGGSESTGSGRSEREENGARSAVAARAKRQNIARSIGKHDPAYKGLSAEQ